MAILLQMKKKTQLQPISSSILSNKEFIPLNSDSKRPCLICNSKYKKETELKPNEKEQFQITTSCEYEFFYKEILQVGIF
jgi:hypothetical protein